MQKFTLPTNFIPLIANGASQIRLPIRPKPSTYHDGTLLWNGPVHHDAKYQEAPHVFSQNGTVFDTCYSPVGPPGEVLLVQEEWGESFTRDRTSAARKLIHKNYLYKGDYIGTNLNGCFIQFAEGVSEERKQTFQTKADLHVWSPAEIMPDEATRFILEVESVQTDILRKITNDEAKLLGLPCARPHRHGANGIERDGEPRDPWCMFHNTGIEDCWICAYRDIWNDTYPEERFEQNPHVWVIDIKHLKRPAA